MHQVQGNASVLKRILNSQNTFTGVSLTKGAMMKTNKLIAVLFAAAFLAACAGTGGQSGKSESKAAEAKPSEALTGDALITANVKSALAADPELASAKVTVSTTDGNVTLKGEVKTLALRRKAEGIVKGVPNVKSLNNQTVVTG
jgi:hyperosmotically inducible periplasmic protein